MYVGICCCFYYFTFLACSFLVHIFSLFSWKINIYFGGGRTTLIYTLEGGRTTSKCTLEEGTDNFDMCFGGGTDNFNIYFWGGGTDNLCFYQILLLSLTKTKTYVPTFFAYERFIFYAMRTYSIHLSKNDLCKKESFPY